MATVRENWCMCCPKCGDDDGLKVKVTTWAALLPEGTDPEGDQEWGLDSELWCACGWEGTVNNAQITAHTLTPKQVEEEVAKLAKLSDTRGTFIDMVGRLKAKELKAAEQHYEALYGDWKYQVANGDTMLSFEGFVERQREMENECRFEPDRLYFWWNAGEIAPTILEGAQLSPIVDEMEGQTGKDLVEGLDMQGFWIGFTANAATVVIDLFKLKEHGMSVHCK